MNTPPPPTIAVALLGPDCNGIIHLACRLARSEDATVSVEYFHHIHPGLPLDAAIPAITERWHTERTIARDVAKSWGVRLTISRTPTRDVEASILQFAEAPGTRMLVLPGGTPGLRGRRQRRTADHVAAAATIPVVRFTPAD
jgi:hypothetical protein